MPCVNGPYIKKLVSFLLILFVLIPGSAADLVKSAMIDIDREIFANFPHCRIPLRPSKVEESTSKSKSKRFKKEGAYFLLQLHDELLYEVCGKKSLFLIYKGPSTHEEFVNEYSTNTQRRKIFAHEYSTKNFEF